MKKAQSFKEARHPRFWVGAVMLSLRFFSSNLQSRQGFLFFFVVGNKNVNNFFHLLMVYKIYMVYICIRN